MAAEFRSPNRRRAAVAFAVYGVILAVVLGLVVNPATGAAVALVAATVVWRKQRSGLFVTDHAVVARNVGLGWRVPLDEVAEISLMSTATDASRRAQVWVISEDGNCHQVTSLSGNPLRGEHLLAEVRSAVTEARCR